MKHRFSEWLALRNGVFALGVRVKAGVPLSPDVWNTPTFSHICTPRKPKDRKTYRLLLYTQEKFTLSQFFFE